MTVQEAVGESVKESPRTRLDWGAGVRWLLGAELFLLLAFAQVLFAGYRVGVGNQSIQIPFLKHYVDPQLYANDPMLRQTLADYPSYFFRLLAILVARVDLYSAYFWLHVLTAAGVLWACYELGRAIFKSRATGAVLVLLVLAGHHRALAGDDLYSVGFTHTWAVFPLAILAMVLLYGGWLWAAFALVGIVFNLHALTAGYLLVMFLTWAIFDYRRPGWAPRLAGMLLLFAVLASPTLAEMVRHRQVWGPEWLERTRLRSADHSFPSSWWTTGASDIPRFVLLAGLAALALSFSADRGQQRKSLLIAAGAAFLFLIGWVFTDLLPVSLVVRAQLFRSSRLLVVLMLAHVAYGIVAGWRVALARTPSAPPHAGLGGEGDDPGARAPTLPLAEDIASSPHVFSRTLEPLLATATLICLAVPGLFSLAPWLLLAAAVIAVVSGRLAWPQALVASLAALVTVAAWRTIEFHIPGIDDRVSLDPLWQGLRSAGPALAIAAGVAVLAYAALRVPVGPRAKLCAAVAVVFVCAALGLRAARTLAASAPDEQRAWVAAQDWAARNTPKDALFITPPQQGGFRIRSERSVVCEWRDGTQLYFSAAFARDWWDKLRALRPAVVHGGAGGAGELMRTQSLETMTDGDLVRLAKSYGATHVVLPSGGRREMKRAYDNGKWAIYEPRVLDAEDAFVENVAKPNIEKYRKSDVRLTLADASGRALGDGAFEIRQTRQAFGFGVSIPFFADPPGDSGPDFEPPQVTPRQLELVKGVFNYSVIPFSAKWQRIEPEQGKWDFSELDKYVDWCTKNGVAMEFHYLGGFTPSWARRLGSDGMKRAWIEHCRKTIDRYQDRIKYWQVTNDKYLIDWCAEVVKEARQKYPHLKWGISDCAKFGSAYGNSSSVSELLNGADEVDQLKAEGAPLDFFSTHGHNPRSMRFDLRQVYECVDAFAKHGVKVHVSEATIDFGLPMLRASGGDYDRWTPETVAEFYEKFYTVLFASPATGAINYWDLGPSMIRGNSRGGGGTGRAGLLDPDRGDEPRPLYHTLKTLIRDRWMTRLDGRPNPDGSVAFRGFHGDYEVTVTTPAGKRLKGRFSVSPDSPNAHQLKLTEESGGSVATGR
jgi:endo-1,4-beta-xylanase